MEDNNKDIEKALVPFKTEIVRVESYANALEIKTGQNLIEATDELAIVKTIQRRLLEKKEGITKPFMTALKNLRALFAPLEAKTAWAEQTIKGKMIRYQEVATAKAEKKSDKIAADVESGKIGFDEGVAKQAKIAEPAKTVSTDTGQITYRTVRKVVIENPELLPREYLVPDLVKIRTDALAGKQIAGVKIVEEKIISARA